MLDSEKVSAAEVIVETIRTHGPKPSSVISALAIMCSEMWNLLTDEQALELVANIDKRYKALAAEPTPPTTERVS